MREAVGGSLLMYLVVFFVSVVILFFVGIMSYSKAYRVKNRIISIIEKYEAYGRDEIKSEINADLRNIGYKSTSNNLCSSNKVKNHLKEIGITEEESEGYKNYNNTSYNYCLFRSGKMTDSYYYVVVTFVSFEFPIIGDMITYPVYGETKILGKNYNY